jgi:hypothetical protein
MITHVGEWLQKTRFSSYTKSNLFWMLTLRILIGAYMMTSITSSNKNKKKILPVAADLKKLQKLGRLAISYIK